MNGSKSPTPMTWQGRDFNFTFPRRAVVMGVVNVTPDSFSDGGRYFKLEDAVSHAQRLVAEGAEILDIGGESTRPNSEPVSEEEELRRVIPVIRQLSGISVPISIDTYKPSVARAAAAVGASIVNDVGAGFDRSEMFRVVSELRLGYVAMHMRGNPQTMQEKADYTDVTAEVSDFLRKRLVELMSFGVNREQVALDPGIGFAKKLADNLTLLRELEHFSSLARPLLLGISRKSFIGRVVGLEPADRVAGSLAGAIWAIQHGAQIIRAHDVAETVQAVRMIEAIRDRSR